MSPIYRRQMFTMTPPRLAIVDDLFLSFLPSYFHATQPLHANDTIPVVISAVQNIENIELFLPKKAEITAEEGDILGLYYFGQNINSTDVSEIAAIQGNINFGIQSSSPNPSDTGAVQAGPGSLFIQAGGSITLGNAQGIQTVGGEYNPILGTKGSDLIIIAGYNKYTPADIENFFDTMNTMDKNYTNLMDADQTDQANELLQNNQNTDRSAHAQLTIRTLRQRQHRNDLLPDQHYFRKGQYLHHSRRRTGRWEKHLFQQRSGCAENRHIHGRRRGDKYPYQWRCQCE